MQKELSIILKSNCIIKEHKRCFMRYASCKYLNDYRKIKLNIRIIFNKTQNCKNRICTNKHELRLKDI